MLTIAILAYEGIEPIDIGATYGVLSMARRVAPGLQFFVVAKTAGELAMAGGLRLVAQHGLDACPAADILMVPGGPGWPAAAADASILGFITAFHRGGGVVAAVCTGGMIVAATGLLAGLPATTKREIVAGETSPLALLGETYPDIDATAARIVDTGAILTGGGVSLGIDMTLHLIRRFMGQQVADETARILEYRAAWQANAARLPDIVRPPSAGGPEAA